MMLVVVIQVAIVNVCVQLLLLILENVTDMAFISSGEHKNYVVSQTFRITVLPLDYRKTDTVSPQPKHKRSAHPDYSTFKTRYSEASKLGLLPDQPSPEATTKIGFKSLFWSCYLTASRQLRNGLSFKNMNVDTTTYTS